MSGFLPAGYTPIADLAKAIGKSDLGRDLAAGSRRAYRLTHWGELHLLSTEYWRRPSAEATIDLGEIPKLTPGGSKILEGGQRVLVKDLAPAPQAPPSPAPPQEPPPVASQPWFIRLMMSAVAEFKITENIASAPKHETLVEHFKAQRMPDGQPISANLAKYLATFCRPPEAMKGGNKPMR